MVAPFATRNAAQHARICGGAQDLEPKNSRIDFMLTSFGSLPFRRVRTALGPDRGPIVTRRDDVQVQLEAAAFAGLVERLTLTEKVALLTGQDSWSTLPMDSIGLRSMILSDGPSGVRGPTWDERSPSLNLPSATALSSSWDVAIAARYGAVAAAEARRKKVDVILGPTINLHRSPLGGRHFEAFSEDPELTSALAVSYVRGVQDNGVAATPKHYVANDFETQRYTADVLVDERTLRELYLLPFEKAVTEGGAWSVMSAYNSVNGATNTENELLSEPLTGEWGFDGVVVSDWTAVRSIESARHPQDLAMPGPNGAWGEALVDAVRRGEVAEKDVDRKVARLLLLAARVGALTGHPEAPVGPAEDGVAFAREAAAEGSVLVRNESLLPVAASRLRRVAVIGENARFARTQGGGSATVIPGPVTSPWAGLTRALPDATVDYHVGATVQRDFAELDRERILNPVTGEQGVRVSYRDADDRELLGEDRYATTLINFGGDDAVPDFSELILTTRYTPELSGSLRLGFAHPGHGRLIVDGRLVLDEAIPEAGADQIDAFFAPDYRVVDIAVEAAQPITVELRYQPGEPVDSVQGSFAVTLGTKPPVHDEEALISEAVEAARGADLAVVVVGTNSRVECEGYDRTDLRLPGRQDDLVSAVAAVNPSTVVVVNSGAPVEMPWRSEVAAVLLTWFGGQEYGNAVADMLLGRVEPGGRLPTTWPATLADVPVFDVTPVGGRLAYSEGIDIGYRAWLKADREPAFPFGHGLGYTTWDLEPASLDTGTGGSVALSLVVTNTGDRPGKQVVQVYASRPSSTVDRPVRWLVGFQVVRCSAGESQQVRIDVPARALAHWSDGWVYEPGEYEFLVGRSSSDLAAPVTVHIDFAGVPRPT